MRALFATILMISAASPVWARAQTQPQPQSMKRGGAVQPTPAPAPPAAATAKKEPLDINTASEADLKELAGVGDAYAKKIVDGRPYAKKDQLVSKKILPKATYDKIKDQIIAKQ